METQEPVGLAWIIIVASLSGDASKLTNALSMIDAKVDLVATYNDVMTLSNGYSEVPDLQYMMADEICGLERAIRL